MTDLISPSRPLTFEETRILAAAWTKAQKLFTDDGYTCRLSDTEGVYLIYKPNTNIHDYAVDVNEKLCTCPAYEHTKICKHLLAVLAEREREEEEREEAIIAAYETSEYGRLVWLADAAEHITPYAF
jgi:hypothetical protein